MLHVKLHSNKLLLIGNIVIYETTNYIFLQNVRHTLFKETCVFSVMVHTELLINN